MTQGSPARVLVYRVGSLGDTLVALPAFRALRRHFEGARITLLCDRQVGRSYVLAGDLLEGTGLVDDVMIYPLDRSRWGRILRPARMLSLLAAVRRRKFDAFVYLVPQNRAKDSIERDRRYFSWSRIPRLLGFEGFPRSRGPRPPGGFPRVPHEADQILGRLAASGVSVPAPGMADLRLVPGAIEYADVERWLAAQPADGGRAWISVGPGGKQPVNLWPTDRYHRVLRELVARYDVWPVIFGGAEDRRTAAEMVAACGRGYVAAGALSPKAGIAAMERCVLHVGNDTGTMHMAVAAGLRCVGVYSSHNDAGWWDPYGSGHRVLRTPIECENCELFDCRERRMECILAITPERVIAACDEVFAERGTRVAVTRTTDR